MTQQDIALYVCLNTKLAKLLGVSNDESSAASLTIEEVGDGNLNYVYIVEGAGAFLIIFPDIPSQTHNFNTFLSHTTSFMSFTRPKFTFPSHFLSQITPLPIQMKQVLLQH